MLHSTKAHRIELARLKRREPGRRLVQIVRGVYFDVTDVSSDTPIWVLQHMVTIARAFALKMQFGSSVSLIFTGECAGKILGLDTWWDNPDILFRADTARKRKRRLPDVPINGRVVAGVMATHVTGGLRSTTNECANVHGIFLAPPVVMIADSARREHTQQAFVLACMLLMHMTGFDRFRPEQARKEAAKLREQWLERAEAVRGQRAYRILLAILREMETGLDSPLEAAVLWVVRCLFPGRPGGFLANQYRVETASGSVYFLDFAFPSLGAGLEADGRIKYGTTYQQARKYAGKHTNRHQDLADAGWTIRHLTVDDVSGPDSVRRVYVHLEKLGLKPRMVGRHRTSLYQPPTSELYSKSRRL